MRQILISLSAFLLACSCATNKKILPVWQIIPNLPALPPPDEGGFANVNDIKLYYAVFNKQAEKAVVLLHGGFASSDYWAYEVPALSKTYRVIVVDSRGHGRSTMTQQPFTYDLMASDVLQLLNYLKIEKASIIGWSDGGIIGLLLAINHPDRVDKLFTYGSNYNQSAYRSESIDSLTRVRTFGAMQSNYRKLSSTPDSFSRLSGALQKMYSNEPNINLADLKKIQAPTVIAGGEHDIIKYEHFKELASLIPGATLVILPKVGHGGPIQDPVHFHKAVMKWLNKD
jgi:pimeloyl-ACP methyl ester carboxylesterase